MNRKILKAVGEYYTDKVLKHGNTSLGVDWNSKESQYLRFEQLCKVIKTSEPFSILDYGCGYAELINYLASTCPQTTHTYLGYDVSEKMIEEAEKLFGDKKYASFCSVLPVKVMDYIVASGIFNVKLDLAEQEEWLQYILETLGTFDRLSLKGFSFNALTLYSDADKMKDYLYYADPLFLFDYCKKNFSRNVALLHDYELYEFTIIVRK